MTSTPFLPGKIFRKDGKPVTLPAAMLADGERVRVPVILKDGETNGLCNDCGGSGLYPSSVRCPSCHGTGGSGSTVLNACSSSPRNRRSGGIDGRPSRA
jgi:hypothetical protein